MRRFLLNVILVLAIVLFLRYVHYSLEPEPSNQPDTYSNFSSLAENESPADYDISYNEKKGSKVLIMSPHGGRIEGGVSELVRYFNNEYSTYLFEGLKSHDNQTLHITTRVFLFSPLYP
ncbi:poly-gamma-glutamate hydrolase family protein [Bacillus subtilis]|uniref:poly-gamma-glutamate hydrolase family protein n=1 Tax=Bacillus subtilis TaxID=1423 RepID=UPI00035EF394